MPLRPVIIRVDGLWRLEQQLKVLREEFGVRTGGVIIRGLRKGARLVRDEARRRVPRVPSGYAPRYLAARGKKGRQAGKVRRATPARLRALLRSNIVEHAIPTRSRLARGRPTVLVRVRNRGYDKQGSRLRFREPGSSPGWWWWLEFGTSRRAATPFLRPAWESRREEALEVFKRSVKEEIGKLFAKHTGMVRRAA